MKALFLIVIILLKFIQNQKRSLQTSYYLIDSEYLLSETYKNIIEPENTNYIPKEDSYVINNKPEYLLITNQTDSTIEQENSKKNIYEYTGALGLGSGVIAIIVFMIIGLIICIIGLATPFPM